MDSTELALSYCSVQPLTEFDNERFGVALSSMDSSSLKST